MINTGLINYNKPFTLADGSLTTDAALSTTLQNVKDKLGNSSPLQLATNRIALGSGTISGTSLLNFPDAGTTAADGISFGSAGVIHRDGDGQLNFSVGIKVPTTGYIQVKSGSDGRFIATGNGIVLSPGTLTGSSSTSALSISQTWNTTGNPTLIFANVTNTASGASANLMDLQVGGVSRFTINKNGLINLIIAGSGLSYYSTGIFFRSSFARISYDCGNGSSPAHLFTRGEIGITKSSTEYVPPSSSIVAIESTTQGFLPPRMTTSQKNAIASPAAGLMVYDTTLNQMSYYNGTAWVNF